MATEEGIVLKLHDSTTALVKTKRSSACESCSSKDSCQTTGGGVNMEVEVVNIAGAKVGDTVVIEVQASSLLKASFLIHIFPILCLVAGAVVGQEIAPTYNWDLSTASALTGFLFFSLAFLIIKVVGKKMASKDAYKPKVIRVKRSYRTSFQ